MEYITLVKYREECGGCPTNYIAWDDDGNSYDFYLRHGYMRIENETTNELLFSGEPRNMNLNGVCDWDDFLKQAKLVGIIFDDSEAEYESRIEEEEREFRKMFSK
ncbi:MAG: hypothetical protein PHP29_09590 [Tissierellia bacterium]|nr:hypothetical protein [Tissierellia bacterium]